MTSKKHKVVKVEKFIHVLSDDTIKEGDWYIHHNMLGVASDRHEESPLEEAKKIIASTDSKLIRVDSVRVDIVWTSHIPQIPQSFVESYAKNPVEYVELEYEIEVVGVPNIWMLKLTNNEVVVVESEYLYNTRQMTTQELEDKFDIKLYTREQVKQIADKLLYKLEIDAFEVQDLYDEWYEENLK